MSYKLRNKTQAGSSFLEYAIILGVISAVLMGMNTYIKRGIQARLKEMTDYFISSEQVVELNPTTSSQDTVVNATLNNASLIGGGQTLDLSEIKNIHSTSLVEDVETPFQPPFVESGEGEVVVPPYQPPSE